LVKDGVSMSIRIGDVDASIGTVSTAVSADEQMRLGVSLGHEAYRNGVVDKNNEAETVQAVKGHTDMAVRMRDDGHSSFMDANIRRDIEEYEKAGADFAEYVKGNYDSSADYWRIIKDASGKVVKVLDDGDEKHATVVDHNGVVEKTVELNTSSLTAQLAAVAGNGMTKSEMNRIMMDSHLDYDEESKSWFAKDASGTYTPPESAESTPAAAESKPLSAGEQAKAKGLAAVAEGLWNSVKTGAGKIAGWAADLFRKEDKQMPVNEIFEPEEKAVVPNEPQSNDYRVTKEQWDKLADPDFYGKYEAVVKTRTEDPLDQLNGLSTQCNTFVDAVIKGFGNQVYKDIMPNGSQSPDALYETWKTNPNLIQLQNNDNAWKLAQEYADQGYIVLSAASKKGNHVAFVLPRGYEYDSLPSRDWKQRAGFSPPSGPIDYSPENFKKTWPAFLQSGSYTGKLSPGWAYTPNMVKDNEIFFFVYKGIKNEEHNFYHFRCGCPVFGL
jgi:hypothetical protein